VFQIACHEDVIPVDELYAMCEVARSILVPPDDIQRVIARPFTGSPGSYVRTAGRRDYALPPPHDTLLDRITQSGGTVTGIGKIEDIFSGRGITESIHTVDNQSGVQTTIDAIESGQGTLIFTNLVDFDSVYGHRNDADGYAKALQDFDDALPRILTSLHNGDILIITADHGCDPTMPGTDHSREYVPLLVYGKAIGSGIDIGTRSCFCDLAATLAEALGVSGIAYGESFADLLRLPINQPAHFL
jgi:phosphopentomutase